MVFTYALIENVTQVKMLSASSTYGVGFLTSLASFFCHLLGIECNMYDKKIELAKISATAKLLKKAEAAGASGIMDVKIEVDGTTVFIYGIAYIKK